MAQPDINNMSESEIQAELNSEQSQAIKALFKKGYEVIYKDDKFGSLVQQIEQSGEIAMPVAQLLSTIINSMIKNGGIKDINILFNVAILLMTDLLEGLKEIGIETTKEDGEDIIATGIQLILSANPDIGAAVMANPQMQQMMKENGMDLAQKGRGNKGAPPSPQPQPGAQPSPASPPPQGQPPAGVLGGI